MAIKFREQHWRIVYGHKEMDPTNNKRERDERMRKSNFVGVLVATVLYRYTIEN